MDRSIAIHECERERLDLGDEDSYSMAMDRHVIEALGCTRIVIENGKIVEIGEPRVRTCPLFLKARGMTELNVDSIRENIEFRIQDFGMCTPARSMRMRDFLSYGISELIGMALDKGMIDAAVMVCDGTGTVVVTDPELAQGIGGRVSGIIETSPIEELIEVVGRDNVVDPETAAIDQVRGAELAFSLGHKRLAVTVVQAEDAAEIRRRFGQRVAIFAVHTSGITEEDAETLFEVSDIVTACASRCVRAVARRKALYQAGRKVPVYAASLWGESLLKTRVEKLGKPNVTYPEEPPQPLI